VPRMWTCVQYDRMTEGGITELTGGRHGLDREVGVIMGKRRER